MKLAARAREQRMHEAAEELQRKLRSLRNTIAMIEAARATDGAAETVGADEDVGAAEAATPADYIPQEAPPAPVMPQPALPTRSAADDAPKPRPRPPLKFIRRNLNKFSREAFMAEYEAMRDRDRSGS